MKKMCYNNIIENIVVYGRTEKTKKTGKDELKCILWALSVADISVPL